MEFRILGAFEVAGEDGALLTLGSARERALLALLVLHANEVLSSDRIIAELWPGGHPETAAKIVQLYVSRIRKALGPSRGLLETRSPGYLLKLGAGRTDLGRCEQLVAAATGEPPEARAALLREALALWRGEPLADFAYESFAANEIARLSEWRLGIVEERIAAELEAGAGGELVPEVDMLVRAHPLRERLRAQHMLCLYRAGRQADALGSYREARAILDEQLGLEPGQALRDLERSILQQDPSLGSTRTPPTVRAPQDAEPVRAILVASHDGDLTGAIELSEVLAGIGSRRELILTRLVAPDHLAEATRSLTAHRDDLATRGVAARVAAFSSLDPGADLVRLADGQPIDLVVATVGATVVDDAITTLLEGAPCDVALHVEGSRPASGPVMVPFGAARHDWAALELGAWLARGRGSMLQLIGAASGSPDERDASRLLADASLVVQHATGVVAEPVLSPPGAKVAEVARGAGTLVVGLPDTWAETGLGPIRARLAASPPTRLVFVHRGVRPGGLTPPGELSRYTWSVERSRIDLP